MTASTVEQKKIIYSQQLAAHTIRQWNSIPLVQIMAGKDLYDKMAESGKQNTPQSRASNHNQYAQIMSLQNGTAAFTVSFAKPALTGSALGKSYSRLQQSFSQKNGKS
ncbi:hypothetical protein NP233_g642 [Leucocoprinus birnbaumii]|uniref:Uncharacterized protein n=1 Tax=Leucocoprinus birnbaumii TaxID=56174 RepID=A0AAD5W1Z6_9AGAR|nr:hypothetical protein NP233_g642 [Leucocoprinus birnbaumii]